MTASRATYGLVLAGGGARGAYQVGVIRYLREGLPEPARSRVSFDVIAGSSVGAINGTFIAASADRAPEQGRLLQACWDELRGIDLYHIGLRTLRNLPVWLLGAKLDEQTGTPERASLLNFAPLERVVRDRFSWDRIEQNFKAGLVSALAVTATDVASGRSYVFVQTPDGTIPAWAKDPRRVGVAARIGPEHALASASIPLLFPPVAIGGRYFCDGGLRQVTPLSPALRLGAERSLVVSLRYVPDPVEEGSYQHQSLQSFPGAVFLLSKVMNSLLLDQLDDDLHNLELINSILDGGVQAYGPEFLGHLNEAVTRVRGLPYRRARTLVLRPSKDLGLIAAKRAEKVRLSGAVRGLLSLGLKLAAPADQRAEGDVLSYLMFDPGYIDELVQLGYEDAAARRDELVEFYSPAEDDRQPEPVRLHEPWAPAAG